MSQPRTYNELAEFINTLTPAQREMPVKVYVEYEEYYTDLATDYPFHIFDTTTDFPLFLEHQQPYLKI
jgi:hypothetical protein